MRRRKINPYCPLIIRLFRLSLSPIALIIVMFLLLGGVGYVFIFGKLFPYSPVIIGFEKHEAANTIIYVQQGAAFDAYDRIDALIPGVEDFHALKFLYKPSIFIFRDRANFSRHSPSKARFCAYYNSRVFISPWAMEEDARGEISLEIYLRHELSHSLLQQHTGMIRARDYPAWLLEGIAVYSTDQMGTSFYPSKAETYEAISCGNFMPPFDFKTKREARISLTVERPIAFMYAEFACIVDYLIEKYGKDKFLSYMKNLITDTDHDTIFSHVYQVDFDEFLKEFKCFVEKQAPAC